MGSSAASAVVICSALVPAIVGTAALVCISACIAAISAGGWSSSALAAITSGCGSALAALAALILTALGLAARLAGACRSRGA